ncbi:hypothetical protein CsSME_00035790 [Camellia sinensis var. sinensis]
MLGGCIGRGGIGAVACFLFILPSRKSLAGAKRGVASVVGDSLASPQSGGAEGIGDFCCGFVAVDEATANRFSKKLSFLIILIVWKTNLSGCFSILPATDLVPGDIVEVSVGCKIPADMRMIEMLSYQLRVDQAILTGESCSVGKELGSTLTTNAVYQDKTNILFSGTVVVAGRARAVVVGVGSNTAMGNIRDSMLRTEDEATPLKKKLDEFGTFLAKGMVGSDYHHTITPTQLQHRLALDLLMSPLCTHSISDDHSAPYISSKSIGVEATYRQVASSA